MSIRETYESWKQCISRNLGRELNLTFVRERLTTLGKKEEPESKKFIQVYGQARLETILTWYRQLEQELLREQK